MDRILAGEPWSFDKSLVVLQRYNRLTPLEDLAFDKASFWVQVHNIPIGYRTKSVAEDICNSIGVVDHSPNASECECGSYVRVRVTLDVYQPLCRGRIITVEGGEKIWVNFRYERLPNICYWCGCFDHSDKDYDAWIESRGTLQTTTQQFGSWLRANQSGPSKKGVVRVSGFYEGRAENTSTRRRREGNQFHTRAKSSEILKQPEKENSEMEADLADISNSGFGDVTAKHGKEDSPNMVRNLVGDYFSQKIREIDKDLGINDEPTILAQTENAIPNKDTSPLFDLENLRKDLEENQSPHQALNHLSSFQESRGPPLQDISNIP